MAVQFKVPASPARSTLTIDTFLGADFTNDPANVDIDKSPDLLNMIRDVPGKVRKTMGYQTIATFDGTINGYHTMRGKAHGLVHVGNKLYYGDYDDPTLLYSDAKNNRSRSWQFKATQVTETKTATITDGVANFNTIDREKVTNLKVKVVAKQTGSGTPSPDNIRPITGWTQEDVEVAGRNRYDGSPSFSGYVNINSWTLDSETYNGHEVIYKSSAWNGVYKLMDLPTGTYTFSVYAKASTNTTAYIYTLKTGETTATVIPTNELKNITTEWTKYSTTFNVTTAGTVALRIENTSNSTLYISEYQIESGSTATTFEPYKGKTYTTAFGQTVYGGTLDVLTGELTIDKLFVEFDGSSDEDWSAQSGATGGVPYFRKNMGVTPVLPTEELAINNYKSNYGIVHNYRWLDAGNYGIAWGYGVRFSLQDVNPNTMTVADFKTWLSTHILQVVYLIDTPTTVQLTPQQVKSLVGENHISASTGDVTSCTYTETVPKDRVCILDGKALLLWDGDTVTTAVQNATIPVTMIGGSPAGGGTSYYPLNLLSPGFTEQFLGTAGTTDYHLSYTDLDDTEVRAEVLQNDGTWLAKVEGTDFTVDRETGVVTFVTAPGESPVTGEDNVKITAFKTVVGYSDRINKCSVGILYGASGDLNRLFVSGNPDYVNYQWYSDTDDPTYFPDTNYMLIGTAKSAIVGYAISGSYLAVFKDGLEVEQNVTLVSSTTLEGQTIFATYSTIHGEPAISPDSFQVLSGEPLFLTALGVYALTSQDVIGKEITNLRSFYLNGRLLEEQYLDKAFTFVYKDFYILAVNQKLYILDGLQAVQTDKSAPYSTRQFIGYYRTGVDANVMWEEDGALCFGTLTGKVCKFYTDPDNINNYNDDGEPIHARWETPDIDGKLFYKNKTFRFLAIRLKRSLATSVKIFSMKRGLWSLITDTLQARYLCFWNITFSKFSFSTDKTSRTLTMKIRIKKVDKARFRFENDVYNESFALDKIGLEFVEKGNFKS